MNFKTAWDRGETTYSELGSHYQPIKEARLDKKTGKKIIVEVGQTNIYEMIQASLESTKIENIVKRLTAGDTSVLDQVAGNYIDITDVPTNMIELQNMIMRTKAEFEKLPAEVREKFGNSAEVYVSQYGTEQWFNNLGLKEEEKKELKEMKEVKKEIKESADNDE